MKAIKVSGATGPALDWMVAKCEFKSHTIKFVTGSEYRGNRVESTKPRFQWVTGRYTPCTLHDAEHLLEIETSSYYCPSTSWGVGGPIIERERINLRASGAGNWVSSTHDVPHPKRVVQYGDTPLIAAMRCYCCSKLGDEIDIPEELCQSQSS